MKQFLLCLSESLSTIKKGLLISVLFFALLNFQFAFAQPGVMSLNQDVSGTYANSVTTLKGGVFQARFQENASGTTSGTRNWQFNSDGYNNVWGATAGAGVQTLASYNTTIIPNTTTASGNFVAAGYNANGRLPATIANYYYTYNIIKGSSYASQKMSVLETSYNPINVNSVAQTSGSFGSRVVGITTSATPNAGENIYVRYSTNGFSTSTIVQATGSGTAWNATIPWQNAVVSFYVYTSNKSKVAIDAEVTSFSSQEIHDLSTLNSNNNAGANYSWTPAVGNFIVTSPAGTFSAGIGYASLTNAAGAFLALNGAVAGTGSVTILQTGDSTAELGTNSLSASTNWTSILLNPQGARTISGTTTGVAPLQLIDFSGADNVTFNGLNTGGNSLTISNLSTSNVSGTSTLRFISGAVSNTITNCTILGSSTMAVGTNGGTIYFATDAVTANGNDTNTISNNNIGSAGANLASKAIFGNGSTTTTAIGNSGNIISNNNIFDYFGAAVASSGIFIAAGCNTWSITNNKFYQSATRTWTTGAEHNAINIQNSTATSGAQGFTITGNAIGFATNTGTGTYTMTGSTGSFRAIRYNGITLGTNSDISSNTISNISLTGITSSGTSTSSPFSAILINNGLVSTNNNIIGSQSATGSLVFSTNTTTATDVYGIYNFSVDVWTSNGNSIGGISVTNAAASGTQVVYGLRANTGTGVTWTANNNFVGGTIANSVQLNSTGVASQVIGMQSANAPMSFTSNTVRNLTNNNGTGTTTVASVIGICHTSATPNNTLTLNTIFNLSNSNTTAATTVTGIQFTGGTANVVDRNYIHSLTSSTTSNAAEINGIRVGGGTTIYRNNMIALGAGVSNAIGAVASNSSTSGINGFNGALGTDSFFNNSIYIGGTATAGTGASYAFNGVQTTNVRSFRNNIFVNNRTNSGATGKHYNIKINGTTVNPTGLTINNNVYYGTGTGNVFGFFNSLDVASLSAWQTAVGQDANSYNDNPQFIDPTNATPDLHIHPTNPTPIEASGVDLGVTLDFDGQTRSGFTPTDIGADAGNFVTSIVVCATPSNQPTTFVAGTTTATTIAGSFTAATGIPSGYLVIRSSGAFSGTLVDGTNYPATTVIGNGTVIQSSSATSFAPTALISNTSYTITIFSYNSGACTGGPKYFLTSPLTGVLTTCPTAPTAFVNSAITASSATISWTASIVGGSAATINYTLEVTTDAAFTLPIAGSPFSLGTAVTNNLSGLSASTIYYYRVKANNGSCDSVFLSGNLTTLCANFTLPVSEGFNTTGTAIFPTCWSQQTVVGTSNITFQASSTNPTTTPQEGTRYIYWNSFNIASGNETRLVSPPITSTGTSSVDVEFQWMHDAGSSTLTTEGVQVQYSLDGTTWIDSGAFVQRYNATLTGWNKKTITLPVGAGNQTTIYVGFKFHSTFGNNCSMDAVAIKATPNCLPPTLTATTAITSSTATINWNASTSAPANGYIYEIRTSGVAGSGVTGLVATSTVAAGILTANVTGLSPATSYSVYVQSDCGGSLSAWTAAGTFVSACATPNNPTGLGFTSVLSTSLTLNFTAATPTPTAYVIFRSISAIAPTPVNGTTYASGTAYTFGASSYNCVANGTAVTLAQTGLTSNTQYYYYIFSRDNTNSCFGAPWYSTGVSAGQITCPAAPTAFVNSGITTTFATVSWTASIVGGGANTLNYILEVTTDAAFTLPISGSPFTVGTPTTYSLTGLTSSTQYYYRVKANNTTCDSAYLSGGTFTTACDAITVYPSTSDFTTYLPTTCWNEGDLGDLTVGPTTVGSIGVSDWVADDYLNSTGTLTGAAKMNIDTATGSEWIISPSFAIPSTGLYRVKYNVGATQFGATTALTTPWETDDFVELLVSTTGTSNWTILKTYNSTNVPSNLGQLDDVDLTAYNGQTIRLAFRAFEGATNGAADIDFFVDNLTVELKPNPIVITPSPSATICSGTSTTLVASSATSYAYTWSPSTGLNTTSGSTVVASPLATTVYTVSGVLGVENTTQTITVVVNPSPSNVTISPNVVICQNDISTLVASSQTAGSFNIGVSTASSVAGNTPYRQAVTTNARMQYLITKAELNAAGINSATNITSLTFNTTSAGSGLMSNYEIKLGNTNATSLTTAFLTPTLTTVYSGAYTAVLGANLHTFSTPFAWDGLSNVVINICHTGPGGTTSVVSVSTPSATSTNTNSGSTACTVNTGGTTSANRPTMILGSFSSAPITWSPTTDLFTDAAATLAYTGTATNTVYSKSVSTLIYTATATLGSCSKTANVTVTRKPNTTIATQPVSQTVCEGTSVTLSVVGGNSVAYLYQWFKNGVSIGSATNASLTIASPLPSDSGNYSVEVLGDCGPVLTSDIAVLTVKTNVGITSVTSSANPICATDTATLTANGVVGTNVVLNWWTGSGGTGTNLGSTPTITVGPGTYYARVTGDCGAPQETSFTINAISVLDYANLQFPGTATICLTGSLTAYGQVYEPGITTGAGQGSGITVEFGYNSTDTDPSTWTNWSAASFNVDAGNNDEYQHVFTPISNGTFYYTFRYKPSNCNWQYGGYNNSGGGFWNGTTNVNGQLTVNPNVTPTFTAYAPICSGETLTALPTTSNNGITGTWSPTLDNTTTTTYTFTPASGQCATSITLTIIVNPNVTPTFTAYAPICSGDTLSALPTTSINGITGTWNPTLDNTTTTTYTFTPTSGQCATSTTLTIIVNPNVTPTFTSYTPICSGETLTALPTTSNNGITGTWSPTLDNTTTTTYTFTPTSGQCATSTTLTIIVNPNVTPTFTSYTPICSGETLTALPTTSNNGITGTWSPILDNTTTTTYTFTPTSGQCAASITLTITVNPSVTPTFTAYSPICSGDALTALPTISNNGITGTWNPTLDNTSTTTYTFTPTPGQCASSTTLIITVNPNVTPIFTAYSPICSGDTLTALPTTSNNGITGTWSPTLNNSTTTTYTFTPTSGQCATSTTLTIIVNPNATIATQPVSQTVCEGTSVTLSVVGGNSSTFTYQWFKNGVSIGSATNASLTIASPLPSDSGNYSVEVLGDCGPVLTSDIAVLTVKTNVGITSVTSSANPICATDTATLTANGVVGTNAVLTWWTGTGGTGTNLGSTPTITVSAGTYYARVTGDCGAPQEASFTINSIAQPTYVNLQFPGSASICNGSSLTVYGQVYQLGVTPGAGLQGAGITAEFGYNTADTDPSTWTTWSSTTFNPGGGGANNDEYQYAFTPPTSGTYYYTYRYRQGTCEWLYGGYSGSGGGFWNGTTNVNGQLIVNPSPTASISGNNGPIVCNSSDATFNLAGTSGSVVTYNINGGSNTTVTLTGGNATVTLTNATTTQTLNLVSVISGTCSASLVGSSTIAIGGSTTWVATNGGEWTNGAPTSTSTVIFDANYVISSDFDACTITVSNNAVVSVDSDKDVNLYGALTVSSGSFTLNNNANLMQSSTVTNSGNIILKRNSSALKRQDYTLWSSPLTAVAGVQTLNNFSPLTLLNRFYEYNPSNNLYVSVVPTSTWFSTAKSYLIRMPNNHPTYAQVWNGTFNGVPNNGNQTYTMASGFNAVGNPYPSRLNVHNFIDGNTNIDGSLYFWRKTNDDTQPSYATLTKMAYVANGALGGDTGTGYFSLGNESNWVVNIGQGFIVNAYSATNLNFNNSMRRSLNSAQFFRSSDSNATISETNLYWLNLNVGTAYSQMAVGYTADATLAFDRGIDGKNINPEFYLTSLIGSEEYTIQGRPEFTNTDVVPLSFKVIASGTYSISLNNTTGLFIGGAQPIYLKDNITNTYHDLNTGNYSFVSDAGTFTNRFEIVYQSALGVENPNLNNVVVYNQNNEVIINSGNVIMDSVKIFDIRGRLLMSKSDINATETRLNVGKTNQVLIVQITSIDGIKVTRKVIN